MKFSERGKKLCKMYAPVVAWQIQTGQFEMKLYHFSPAVKYTVFLGTWQLKSEVPDIPRDS